LGSPTYLDFLSIRVTVPSNAIVAPLKLVANR